MGRGTGKIVDITRGLGDFAAGFRAQTEALGQVREGKGLDLSVADLSAEDDLAGYFPPEENPPDAGSVGGLDNTSGTHDAVSEALGTVRYIEALGGSGAMQTFIRPEDMEQAVLDGFLRSKRGIERDSSRRRLEHAVEMSFPTVGRYIRAQMDERSIGYEMRPVRSPGFWGRVGSFVDNLLAKTVAPFLGFGLKIPIMGSIFPWFFASTSPLFLHQFASQIISEMLKTAIRSNRWTPTFSIINTGLFIFPEHLPLIKRLHDLGKIYDHDIFRLALLRKDLRAELVSMLRETEKTLEEIDPNDHRLIALRMDFESLDVFSAEGL